MLSCVDFYEFLCDDLKIMSQIINRKTNNYIQYREKTNKKKNKQKS